MSRGGVPFNICAERQFRPARCLPGASLALCHGELCCPTLPTSGSLSHGTWDGKVAAAMGKLAKASGRLSNPRRENGSMVNTLR
jgi:hypothetical protein